MIHTERFTDRVSEYVKFRPTYPVRIVEMIEQETKALKNAASAAQSTVGTAELTVADPGSGTGLFTAVLLGRGHKVFAVEPNEKMRLAAEEILSGQPNFTSIAASAEATTLPDQSVDVITAAQAFHWFDEQKAKIEFQRILKPQGLVAQIWNERETKSPFGADYETFLRQFWDYVTLSNRSMNLTERIGRFFKKYELHKVPNPRTLDWETLKGFFYSTSYSPKPRTPEGEKAGLQLKEIFDQHQKNGIVHMAYETEMYLGTI